MLHWKPDEVSEGLPDWNALGEELKKVMINNVMMLAEMPQGPPIRLITGTTEGIHPVRSPSFKPYYSNTAGLLNQPSDLPK